MTGKFSQSIKNWINVRRWKWLYCVIYVAAAVIIAMGDMGHFAADV